MRLSGLLPETEQLREMAYAQKKAEAVMTALEQTINAHLLKIWTMPDSEFYNHWLKELLNWLDEVGEIVLKPGNRRPKAAFYYRILFEEPFAGVGLRNLTSRLRRLQREGYIFTENCTPSELLSRLENFHKMFAQKSALAPMPEAEIIQLLQN